MNTESFRNNLWKWVTLAVVAIFSIYVTLPVSDVKDDEGKVVQKGKIRLGLDLKGGTSFTLGVDRDKLAETITASLVDKGQTNAEGVVDRALVDARIEETLNNCDSRIVEVVRRRVDGMGMNEPVIQSLQDHRLLVQLPGADDATRLAARESIQKAAFLQFCLVHPKNDQLVSKLTDAKGAPEGYEKIGSVYKRAENFAAVSKMPGHAARVASFHAPLYYRLMLEPVGDGTYRPVFIKRTAELTGDSIVNAYPDRDNLNRPVVNFQLNAEGGHIFSRVTRKNIDRRLAIILDDTLVSAPVINSEIGSRGEISGNFTFESARQLANELKAGALPAPLQILSESHVSPTVGDEAISAGIVAAVMGFLLVAVFMFIYYWYMGLVADAALFLDIVLLPAALVLVSNVLGVFAQDAGSTEGGMTLLPVLTMPGIAGLVLTLGMAVDANVLIFERIREEFQKGANVGTAIKNGYGRAFTAIFDSNITTILTGAILFIVGTGPVRGYAITLTAGVIISMFTAVVVTRIVLDLASRPDSSKPFKMRQFFKAPNFDFVKYGKKTILASFVIIVVTLLTFFIRAWVKPASVLAVDLTGGTSIVYHYDEGHKPSEAVLRDALAKFDNAAVIQFQSAMTGGKPSVLVKTGFTTENGKDVASTEDGRVDVAAKVTELITAAAPDANFTLSTNDEVGSVVGADLKKSGTWAVILSLIAILAYVGIRFEFGFGLGAIMALAHDALISLGLYSLCGRQVSLIVITALLTIIGYSVNDTIVVFDRIREDLKRDSRTPFKELCNRAINGMLSRTVITSVTTFFAVLALFTFGDGAIYDFALVMLLGVVAGTYSSIFIATPIMMWFYRGKRPEFDTGDGDEQ